VQEKLTNTKQVAKLLGKDRAYEYRRNWDTGRYFVIVKLKTEGEPYLLKEEGFSGCQEAMDAVSKEISKRDEPSAEITSSYAADQKVLAFEQTLGNNKDKPEAPND